MPMLKFDVPNTLAVDEAKKRVEALLDYWNRQYGVTSQWVGAKATMVGRVVGVSVDGNLEVRGDRIAGEAADPGFLLRGQAQKYLTRKFGEYLDPSRSLEDLRRGEG
jgi:hypothetical protein